MKILVTGCVGFIGFHLTKALLEGGYAVVGVDNLDTAYSVELKEDRLQVLPHFPYRRYDLSDASLVSKLFEEFGIGYGDIVIHLAARAGVRASSLYPHPYIKSNLVGFHNVLSEATAHKCQHFIFASSSSVYGRAEPPFVEEDPAAFPLSLYAATKRSNELMGYAYSYTHGIPVTGLRFLGAYGEWGRPDSVIWIFLEGLLNSKELVLLNEGENRRDFTYVADVVEAIMALMPPTFESVHPGVPYRILNVTSGINVRILDLLSMLEEEVGVKANVRKVGPNPSDIVSASADPFNTLKLIGREATTLQIGLSRFSDWFKSYHSR